MKYVKLPMTALLVAAALLSGCGKSAEDALKAFGMADFDRYLDYDAALGRRGAHVPGLEEALKVAAKTDMLDSRVQLRVGVCKLFGMGVASDAAEGLALLDQAAGSLPEARNFLLRHHLAARNLAALGRDAARFAEKGDMLANVLLARLQLLGKGGVAQDVPAARARLERILSSAGAARGMDGLLHWGDGLLEDAALLLYGICIEDGERDEEKLFKILLAGYEGVTRKQTASAELSARLGSRLLEGRGCRRDVARGLDVLSRAVYLRESGNREDIWSTRAAWWSGVVRCAGPVELRDVEKGVALLQRALEGAFEDDAEKDAVQTFLGKQLAARRQKRIFGQTLGARRIRCQSDPSAVYADKSKEANGARYVYTAVLPYDADSRREVAGWEFPWTVNAFRSFCFDRKDYFQLGNEAVYRIEMSWEVPRDWQPGKYLRKIRDEVRAYFNVDAPVVVEAPWHGDSDPTTIQVWDLEASRIQLAFRKDPCNVMIESRAVMTFSIQLKDEHGNLVGELQDASRIDSGTR